MDEIIDKRVEDAEELLNEEDISCLKLTQDQIKSIYGKKGGLRQCAEIEPVSKDYKSLASLVASKYRTLKIESVGKYLKTVNQKKLEDQSEALSEFMEDNSQLIEKILKGMKEFSIAEKKSNKQAEKAAKIHVSKWRYDGDSFVRFHKKLPISFKFSVPSPLGELVSFADDIKRIVKYAKEKKANRTKTKFRRSDEGKELIKNVNEFLRNWNKMDCDESDIEEINFFHSNQQTFLSFANACSQAAYKYLTKNFPKGRKLEKIKKSRGNEYKRLLFVILICRLCTDEACIRYAESCY